MDHERAEAYLQLLAEAGLRSGDGLRLARATRAASSTDLDGEVTMDLAVLPPLGRDAGWIEVLAAGRTAEVRVTLPLRWP